MTLVGFRAKNHPQQVVKVGARDSVDERITLPDDFGPLHARFGFTIDVAANAQNRKVDRYFDLASDGLVQSWRGERVWCNPPYSNLAGWVDKAWQEFRAGCDLIVMLLPANRTEQPWWQDLVEPHRDQGGVLTTEFIRRRLNFGKPGNEGAKYNSSAPFGSVLLIWKRA